MTAKCLMIQGTASSVGKSLLVTALCRIFRRRGLRVAPFKSQNMSLNSYITDDGHEISLAQAIQAEAAGIAPSSLMNPVLLKPTGEQTSQVIVMGKTLCTLTAREYYAFRHELKPRALEAFTALASRYDLILMEGAGSPAEINLRENDIANMGMAELADAPVLLVGDIDRGGVFASLYGTVALLRQGEQERIKGFVINKFRGDREILEPGLRELEQRLSRPVLGVLPYWDIAVEEEDSLTQRPVPSPWEGYGQKAAPRHSVNETAPRHSVNETAFREAEYNRLADLVEQHLDMAALERIVEGACFGLVSDNCSASRSTGQP